MHLSCKMSTNINHLNTSESNEPGSVEMNKNVIRESSFYNDIASSARTGTKSQFDLLLAMVSDDATDFDEFNQVYTPTNLTEADLYSTFAVQPKKLREEAKPSRSLHLNSIVHDRKFKDAQLELLLNREALVSGPSEDVQRVYANLDFNTQVKNKDLLTLDLEPQTKDDSSKLANKDAKNSNIHSVSRPNSMDLDLWFNTLAQARSLDLVS